MKAYVIPEMTWTEVAEALKHVKVAIIPVGSNEEHGPGIKLCVDAMQAYLMAKLLCERVHPVAIVTPPVLMGVSAHHGRFPGTIALRPETFMMTIEDIVRSLKRFGITKFFILNTHGENNPALGVISLKLRDEMDVEVCYSLYVDMCKDVINRLIPEEKAGHGADPGLAVAIYLDKSLVKVDQLEKGEVHYWYKHTGKKEKHKVCYPYFTDEVTANGVFGDPEGTSFEIGREIVETAVERLAEFLRDFASKPKPPSRLDLSRYVDYSS